MNRRIPYSGAGRILILLILAAACAAVPAAAATGMNGSAGNQSSGPAIVYIGNYVVDFSKYNAEEGTFEANFYVSLRSNSSVNLTDLEMINGHATAIGTLIDTPEKKYYRVFATMSADPDFRRYPFDRHTLPIIVEPKTHSEREIVLVIDGNETGLDHDAALPGWELGDITAYTMSHSYGSDELPYSRAVFSYDVSRDSVSTFLKFFLPVMLIIIVSLSSLLMKVTSRLGLNASMFLAAVLIHWRVADAIPLVAYATFLDYFMILTYATLVMVLVSGILIIFFSEAKDTKRVDLVNRWSIRIIPALSVSLYALLFLTLVA
ncbi:MAG: hypothetical protein OS112_10210 [Methanoregula sp.]|nr:MAG: hypothetical protein OS112_10210 [Methanoregula sp.]